MPQLDSLILFDQVFLTLGFFILVYATVGMLMLPIIRGYAHIRLFFTRLKFCNSVVLFACFRNTTDAFCTTTMQFFSFINWIKNENNNKKND